MNKLYALLIGAFTPLCMSAQTTYPEWQSQYTTGLNKVEPHAYVLPYSSVEKLQQPGGYEQSAYYMTLNGKWKFHWTKNPDKRPKDFFQNDFAVQGWNDINVPGNWERQGYGLSMSMKPTNLMINSFSLRRTLPSFHTHKTKLAPTDVRLLSLQHGRVAA